MTGGANMVAHRMQAARVARDKARSLGPMPLADQLTYALLAVLATFFVYKIRQHLRQEIDFSKRMLMLSIA